MTAIEHADRIKETAAAYYWYHCIDLGQGVLTDGDYDMNPLLDHYAFPRQMAGLSVLDVGRASGFFSFEFEQRGAAVTATELGSYFDWDFVGGTAARDAKLAAISDPGAHTLRGITGAFHFAKRVKGSQVVEKTINVYGLSPEALGGHKFDIVFAGSITSHLRDPVLAFERLRSVTRGTCIVAAPSFEIAEVAAHPMLRLVGTMDSDRRSWWVVNARGLEELLLCAGFRTVKIVSRFNLANRRIPSLIVEHLVAHATP